MADHPRTLPLDLFGRNRGDIVNDDDDAAGMGPAINTAGLAGIFYRLTPNDLYRLRAAVTRADAAASLDALADAVAPSSERLAAWLHRQPVGTSGASVAALLTTVINVLLTLYVVADEAAPPAQVAEVVDKARTGLLHEMPIPGRVSCFCGSGKRYKRCHGTAPR